MATGDLWPVRYLHSAFRTAARPTAIDESLPHSLVPRTLILLAAEDATNARITQQCGISMPMVTHWKKRFPAHGLAGLHDPAKPGRPRTHDDEAVAALLNPVLSGPPEAATH